MKQMYEKPEMFTVRFENDDVVTISFGNKEDEDYEGNYDDIF